jgi:hypothetical protein
MDLRGDLQRFGGGSVEPVLLVCFGGHAAEDWLVSEPLD